MYLINGATKLLKGTSVPLFILLILFEYLRLFFISYFTLH